MKARGRRPSGFIVFELGVEKEIKSLKSMLMKIRFLNHRHGYDFLCHNLLNY